MTYNQFPHVRNLTVCLACGKAKSQGTLVCWDCHNDFTMVYDAGYGPTMDRVIAVVNSRLEARASANQRKDTR